MTCVLHALHACVLHALFYICMLLTFGRAVLLTVVTVLQAMWRELDALDVQVSAERATRAKLHGEKH